MTDDNRQLARADQGGAIVSRSAEMLAMIRDAATDPTVDAQKMVTLADLAIKLQDREREEQFRLDKVAALLEMPSISKSGKILNNANKVQSHYAKYEDIMRVVKPILGARNLVLSHRVGQSDRKVTVTPVLTHANGHEEVGDTMPLDIDTTGSKNATQGAGSAATYGKRHSTIAMLGIVIEGIDDDGSGSGTPDMGSEKTDVLLADAQIAHDGGNYVEWYQSRSNVERGFLVRSGKHAEFTGHARPEVKPDTTAKRKPATPREWVNTYIAEINRIENLDQLSEYQERQRDNLAKLKDSHSDLYDEAVEAGRQRADYLRNQ